MSEEDGNDGQAGPDHADPLSPSGKQDCYLVPIKGRHLWYFSLSGFDEDVYKRQGLEHTRRSDNG